MMTDKTMPDRIWLQDEGDWEDTTWCMDRINDGDVEYIRADLISAPGSANEPLADGQYQWAMLENEGTWIPIRVEEHDGRFYFWDHDGSSLISGGYSYIGPVLQSPPDQSN